LRDVDPHFRCEPRGCKITQPAGRCVECFSRGLVPEQILTTTVRFNPMPQQLVFDGDRALQNRLNEEKSKQFRAIGRW
jgi:hypothetical protein